MEDHIRTVVGRYPQIGFSTAKAESLLAFVEDLLADGVPIHGVGFQMHVPFAPDPIPRE